MGVGGRIVVSVQKPVVAGDVWVLLFICLFVCLLLASVKTSGEIFRRNSIDVLCSHLVGVTTNNTHQVPAKPTYPKPCIDVRPTIQQQE